MSQLKNIVEVSLKVKGIDEVVLSQIDTYLYRSILRLQKKRVLPPKELRFLVRDRKDEMVVGDDLYAHYLRLPKDFGSVEDFQVFNRPVYYWKANEYDVLNKDESDSRGYFSVVSKETEKILFVNPFPDDTDEVRIKYNVNGKIDSYDWIDETYWEAVITDIELMLGIGDEYTADDNLTRAIDQRVENTGKTSNQNRTLYRTKPSYFGNHRKIRRGRR